MRCVAAVLIFFVPSIVSVLINAVAQTKDNEDADNWLTCWKFVLDPTAN